MAGNPAKGQLQTYLDISLITYFMERMFFELARR